MVMYNKYVHKSIFILKITMKKTLYYVLIALFGVVLGYLLSSALYQDGSSQTAEIDSLTTQSADRDLWKTQAWYCGDNIVWAGEQCDAWEANGVPCMPANLGGSCSYCSAQCQIAYVWVECGDWIINGDEECEVDQECPAWNTCKSCKCRSGSIGNVQQDHAVQIELLEGKWRRNYFSGVKKLLQKLRR